MKRSHAMAIRDAKPEDAVAACETVRRSISELCGADHGGDAEIVARWLANKTPENLRAWIARPDASLLVAVEDGAIRAVGMVSDAGEILMNYVSPDARFRGVSGALLKALEARGRERGAAIAMLESTETARGFYLSNGYVETGAATRKFGMGSGYRMSKALA
jgi:GNAT superfamily N-acetyltransferase